VAEVLVTGASSGIGLLTAIAFAHAGDHVLAGIRDPASCPEVLQACGPGSIDVVPLDITQPTSIDRFVARALSSGAGIDVIVNNAGVAIVAAVEDSDDERSVTLMDTNFHGPLRLIRAVLPHLRVQGHGHIINVSSRSARHPRPFVGIYAASKAALEALSAALAGEVAPFGIDVTIVEPGSFHTAIDDKFIAALRPSEGYPGQAEAIVAERNRDASDQTHHVAQAIVTAAHTHPPPFRIHIPD
jgi:NAD(P)-dependent dehydrogenase (short-subunit alcohol dehydrogenase family)